MANEPLTQGKALTAAAFILVAILGWMFNKIMDNMEVVGDDVETLQVQMAVMQEKMSKQEKD